MKVIQRKQKKAKVIAKVSIEAEQADSQRAEESQYMEEDQVK